MQFGLAAHRSPEEEIENQQPRVCFKANKPTTKISFIQSLEIKSLCLVWIPN